MKWLFMLALAACSKDQGPAPSPLVGKSRDLANQVCACKTADCIAPLQKAWDELATERVELTDKDVDAIAQETQRFEKCAKSTH